jgi:hypothetical protein
LLTSLDWGGKKTETPPLLVNVDHTHKHTHEE